MNYHQVNAGRTVSLAQYRAMMEDADRASMRENRDEEERIGTAADDLLYDLLGRVTDAPLGVFKQARLIAWWTKNAIGSDLDAVTSCSVVP